MTAAAQEKAAPNVFQRASWISSLLIASRVPVGGFQPTIVDIAQNTAADPAKMASANFIDRMCTVSGLRVGPSERGPGASETPTRGGKCRHPLGPVSVHTLPEHFHKIQS